MDFSQINVLDLLPQRPPMVMIDALLHYDPVLTRTAFTVKEDCLFVEEDCLLGEGLTENIAQTCAARMGYINGYLKKEAVKLGFIGAVKQLEIRRLPRVGEALTTEIRVEQEVMGVTLVQAQTLSQDEIVCYGYMKIALTDIDSQ